MSYSVKQSSESIANKRWKWQAWIEAEEAELDQIRDVIWYLHETFPNPVVTITNRADNFCIKQIGWGVFTLYVDVNLKNNTTINLVHQLSFEDSKSDAIAQRGMAIKSANKLTKVFLSYGAEDSELAHKVSKNLLGFGYNVLDVNQSDSGGMPYKLAQQKLLRESDMIVGLVSSDVASPFVLNDLNSARQSNKEAVALVGKNIKPLGLDPRLTKFSLSMDSDDSQLEKFLLNKSKL